MKRRKTALVVGAVGIIGRALLAHLESRDDWAVIGLSRRTPDFPSRARFCSVDLNDPAALHDLSDALRSVTHVFYAAYQSAPTRALLVPPNLSMLRNIIEAVDQASPDLEHVSLMVGYKGYGADLGPYKTPAREDDLRLFPPNFYYDQEDFLREFQRGKNWTWSGVRPAAVCGIAVGNPMNLVSVIAVYASMCRELGVPMRFPGTEAAFHALFQVTDAELLAKAATWIAQRSENAEVYNVPNGDLFRWESVWRRFANHFGLEVESSREIRLVDFMADKEQVWASIAQRHRLRNYRFREIASWE